MAIYQLYKLKNHLKQQIQEDVNKSSRNYRL